MNRLFQIFGSRHASLICTFFALLNRTAFAIFASHIGRDKRLQLTMAENLQAGNGLSLTKYFTSDLSTPVHDYTLHFPPGYSTFIIPLLKLFDNNIFAATTAFDIISGIFFVLIIRSLCKQLAFPVYLINIVTIVAGCSQYIFFMESASSDILSLDFILAGMLVSVSIINRNKKYKYPEIAAYGLLFFAPAFLRYMYIPLVPLFPILIFCAGVYSKNNTLKVTGLQLFFSTITFLTVLMVWLLTVQSAFVSPTEKGFFPDQLLFWYPFFISSFISIDFTAMRIEQFLRVSYAKGYYSLMLCNLFLLPVLFAAIKNMLSKRKFSFFPIAGWTLSLLILLQLAYLTITHKPQTTYGIWNYIHEGRYYAFVNVFLVLFIFYRVILNGGKRNFLTKIFFVILFVLIGIETVHGIYFNAKLPFHYNEMRSRLSKNEIPINYFRGLLTKVKNDNPGKDVFVSSHDSYYLNYSASKGVKAIYDPLNLNINTLKPPQNSILIFVMDNRFREKFQSYLDRQKPQLDTVIVNTCFYIDELASADQQLP